MKFKRACFSREPGTAAVPDLGRSAYAVAKSMNAQRFSASQRLAAAICDYFGKRPHRFVVLLLLGTALMVLGGIMCYRELLQGLADARGGFVGALGCFVLYLLATVWYLRRIRNGTWQQIWASLRPTGGK